MNPWFWSAVWLWGGSTTYGYLWSHDLSPGTQVALVLLGSFQLFNGICLIPEGDL
jgi:hypothetical protein